MSAPRSYETSPFHPPSSVHILCIYQFLCICERFLLISSIWYLGLVYIVVYAGALPERLPLTSKFKAILKPAHFVFHLGRASAYWYEIHDSNACSFSCFPCSANDDNVFIICISTHMQRSVS